MRQRPAPVTAIHSKVAWWLTPRAILLRRYHSDTQNLKIAQGVAGTVKSKGSVSDTLPYLMQAVKQGFQVRSWRGAFEIVGYFNSLLMAARQDLSTPRLLALVNRISGCAALSLSASEMGIVVLAPLQRE